MKKKTLLITISCLLLPFSALALVFNGNNNVFSLKGDGNHYGLSFNSTKNKFFSGTGSADYSGSATVKTNNNNDIEFEYYTVAGGSSSAWHLIKNSGYFYNTTPIHGLESLTIMCTSIDKEFQISWGRDSSFDLGSKNYLSSTDNVYCDFDRDTPTYFKFTNISGSNISIKEMSVALDCVNYYPVLSLDCDSIQGTVTGGGTKNAGESVTIAATPNTGYEFVGWFENDSLVSLNSSYAFTIGYSDLSYTARFKCSNYNLVVESESLTKGQVSNSTGSYAYLDEVTISATPNSGYSFSGWYSGDSLVSTNNPYTFTMPYNDILYVAKFATNSYQLNLSSSDTSLGSITGGGTFLYGSNVTITATPNTGVAFLGWFDSKDDLVSGQKSYSFTMPYNNLKYTAKFEWVPHSISLSVNDDNMGFVSGSGSYHYGQSVTLTATPTEHHSFFGWYDGGTLLSQESSYTFDMPNNTLEYEARFVRNYYLNVYSDNEEMGTVTAPTEWGAGLEVTLTANARDNYALDYWCDENYDEMSYDIDYTFIMPSQNINIIAVFTTGRRLILDSNYENNIVCLSGQGNYVLNRNVTVCSSSTDDYIFDGWYDDNYNLLSKSNPFSFEFIQETILIAYYKHRLYSFSFTNFDDDSKTCSVYAGYSGATSKTIVIPKLYKNYQVTSIKAQGFSGYRYLESISIPNSITSIENNAFYGCDSLQSLIIPDSVVSIGYSAFDSCKSLSLVIISNNLSVIESQTFCYCYSLTSITIPNSVTSIENNAFSHCYRLIEVINESSLNIVKGSSNFGGVAYYANQVISDCSQSKVSIDENGFVVYKDDENVRLVNYVGLETVVSIPNYITSIGTGAFCNCTSLTSINIPTSVVEINEAAFENCTSIKSIIIPNSVKHIGAHAFKNCTSLTSINISNTVTSIAGSAFSGCTSLTSVNLPNSIEYINNQAFENCTSLKSIIIPNSVKHIGAHAFKNCTSLTSIIITKNVEVLYSYAFSGCSSLTIYCEASSKPSGWDSNWNPDNRPVVWGYISG